ncbi:hypothetical protein MMC07_004577 [Pseudocyphellaria aurata]|nr:hypothetical protein [Pseudocyphellaria aurata]
MTERSRLENALNSMGHYPPIMDFGHVNPQNIAVLLPELRAEVYGLREDLWRCLIQERQEQEEALYKMGHSHQSKDFTHVNPQNIADLLPELKAEVYGLRDYLRIQNQQRRQRN